MVLGSEHVGVAVEQTLIGVDHGTKRVGLALKPAGATEAHPLRVVAMSAAVMGLIEELAVEYQADAIVVGLPRNSDGDDTAQTKQARTFAGELADKTGLHVLMHDEFTTSERARQRLSARTRTQEKAELDAMAAVILLEDYLESLV